MSSMFAQAIDRLRTLTWPEAYGVFLAENLLIFVSLSAEANTWSSAIGRAPYRLRRNRLLRENSPWPAAMCC